jgi:hypothetical protein
MLSNFLQLLLGLEVLLVAILLIPAGNNAKQKAISFLDTLPALKNIKFAVYALVAMASVTFMGASSAVSTLSSIPPTPFSKIELLEAQFDRLLSGSTLLFLLLLYQTYGLLKHSNITGIKLIALEKQSHNATTAWNDMLTERQRLEQENVKLKKYSMDPAADKLIKAE